MIFSKFSCKNAYYPAFKLYVTVAVAFLKHLRPLNRSAIPVSGKKCPVLIVFCFVDKLLVDLFSFRRFNFLGIVYE